MSSLFANFNSSTARKIVNWATTADGRVTSHRRRDSTRQLIGDGVGGVSLFVCSKVVHKSPFVSPNSFLFITIILWSVAEPHRLWITSPTSYHYTNRAGLYRPKMLQCWHVEYDDHLANDYSLQLAKTTTYRFSCLSCLSCSRR